MIESITNFLIIFFIFQQLKSQISQIDQNGYNPFCDEALHISIWGCAADMGIGFSAILVHSWVRNFTNFTEFSQFRYIDGLQIAYFCLISAVLVYCRVAN